MRFTIALFSLLLAGNGAPSPAAESPFGFHPGSVAKPGYWNNGFSDAQQIGVRWTRDGVYAFWFLVQPDRTKNEYDFTRYDRQYAAVPATMHILANIAPQGTIDEGYCQPGSYLPIDKEQYRRFVRAVVERYDGDGIDDMPGLQNPILHWQVGNEPVSSKPGFAELQKMTYVAIKEACDNCTVLIGGATGMPPATDYIAQFDRQYRPILDALGGRYVDVMDVHWYGNATGDYRGIGEVVEHVRAVLAADGFASIPVWITEMGTYSGDPRERPGDRLSFGAQSERQQALDLFKRFVFPLSLGVKKIFPAFGLMEGFKYDGGYFDFTGLIYDGWGPYDLGLGQKKLAWYTYKMMTEKLENADWSSVEVLQDAENIFVCRVRKNGEPLYVVWWDSFNDQSFAAGGTRNVRLTGMPAGTLCVTEVVPAVASGPEVIDYAGAFKKNLLGGDGGLDLTLGDSPVVVELPPPSRRRAVSH